LSRHIGQLRQQAQAVEQLMEQRLGVILVNEFGKAVFLNRRAETLVRIQPQLNFSEGKIRLGDRKAAAQLDRLVRRAIDTSLGRGMSAGGALPLAAPTTDVEPIVVVVTPLRLDTQASAMSGPAVLRRGFLGSPNERQSIDQQMLHSLYSLTPARRIGGGNCQWPRSR
jgi:hypothetical protein